MKRLKLVTKILIAVFIIGLSLLVYPSFSNYWNRKHATKAVIEYSEQIKDIDNSLYEDVWTSATEYNRFLARLGNVFTLPDDLKARYPEELKVSENGLMGYVDIPSMGVSLPIFHGTSESVLQIGVGHIEWSSLPVGGESSHCVLSGHRGLPSAKLFTDLNKLREGDTFSITVLNETLTYEVDQIRTVLPNELTELLTVEGHDYCTLLTCTPYGINSHRLLVRGHRVATAKIGATVISEAVLVDQLIVALYLAVPLVFILFMAVMLKKPPKKITIDPITLNVSVKKRNSSK